MKTLVFAVLMLFATSSFAFNKDFMIQGFASMASCKIVTFTMESSTDEGTEVILGAREMFTEISQSYMLRLQMMDAEWAELTYDEMLETVFGQLQTYDLPMIQKLGESCINSYLIFKEAQETGEPIVIPEAPRKEEPVLPGEFLDGLPKGRFI